MKENLKGHILLPGGNKIKKSKLLLFLEGFFFIVANIYSKRESLMLKIRVKLTEIQLSTLILITKGGYRTASFSINNLNG